MLYNILKRSNNSIYTSASVVLGSISWDNDNIQLGKGPRADNVVVVNHIQTVPYSVNYFAIMTHETSSWRFYEGGLKLTLF